MSAHEPIQALIAQIDRKIHGLRELGSRHESAIARWRACRRELESLVAASVGDTENESAARANVVPLSPPGQNMRKVSGR